MSFDLESKLQEVYGAWIKPRSPPCKSCIDTPLSHSTGSLLQTSRFKPKCHCLLFYYLSSISASVRTVSGQLVSYYCYKTRFDLQYLLKSSGNSFKSPCLLWPLPFLLWILFTRLSMNITWENFKIYLFDKWVLRMNGFCIRSFKQWKKII